MVTLQKAFVSQNLAGFCQLRSAIMLVDAGNAHQKISQTCTCPCILLIEASLPKHTVMAIVGAAAMVTGPDCQSCLWILEGVGVSHLFWLQAWLQLCSAVSVTSCACVGLRTQKHFEMVQVAYLSKVCRCLENDNWLDVLPQHTANRPSEYAPCSRSELLIMTSNMYAVHVMTNIT